MLFDTSSSDSYISVEVVQHPGLEGRVSRYTSHSIASAVPTELYHSPAKNSGSSGMLVELSKEVKIAVDFLVYHEGTYPQFTPTVTGFDALHKYKVIQSSDGKQHPLFFSDLTLIQNDRLKHKCFLHPNCVPELKTRLKHSRNDPPL